MSADDPAPISDNYRDYVIRDGKLIGRFDEMYRHSAEVPWHQDETVRAIFSDITIAILRHYPARTVFDVGCGLGYMTSRLARELPGVERVVGADISATAVSKARQAFPDLQFVVGGVHDAPVTEQFDLVVTKDVLWYVIDDLDRYLDALLARSAKWVYVGQSFPDSRPFLGDQVLPDAAALFQRLQERSGGLVYSIVERDAKYGGREYAHAVIEVKR